LERAERIRHSNSLAVAAHQGRKNNFNLLRVAAAAAVLVSHCYPIAYGPAAVEPLSNLLGITLGHLVVLIFFIISGFFVSQSFARSAGLTDFVAARVLRLYPALIVVSLVTIAVIGPITTQLPIEAYFSESSTFFYLPRSLSLKWLQDGLPGVFLANPFPVAVNGSLWTLFYEVVCYAGAATVAAYIRDSTRRASFCFVAIAAGYLALSLLDFHYGLSGRSSALRNFQDLVPAFVAGMIFFHYRKLITLRWTYCLMLGVPVLVLSQTALFQSAFLVFLSYLVFLIGFNAFPFLHSYNQVGDYSYGTYVYAFPIQQAVASVLPGISPFGLFCVAAPIVAGLSVASWHLVEEPALRSRVYLRARLGRPRMQVESGA